ncbi:MULTISPECIES: hypothetical protein [unclassified Streptomyces]|uniref:hypothetical protein n=1 Tax=unclassified Streptomyces TaxID=2593676 RepID=UPI002B1E43DB|nr:MULTISPECIES: hypothetical protein [unclassified Streptomyces]
MSWGRLPFAAGAHPGLSGPFSLLQSADTTAAKVVYLPRFTSDLYAARRCRNSAGPRRN